MAQVGDETVRAGREALARHAWNEAFALLTDADARGLLDTEDLELLAEAAYWAGKLDTSLTARERAYCAHLDAGNRRHAAYLAMLLARGHANKLALAVSAGWRAKAERLLADQPECVEHGHLALRQSNIVQGSGDLDRAYELAERAMTLGERFGDRDLWALGAHRVGQISLQQGAVDRGLALIDEASASALSGELTADTTGLIYCWTISACRDLADVKRAAEWTEAARHWCDRQSISGFPGVCRIHRAEIMRLRGAWVDAEREALRAGEELPYFTPFMAGAAYAELGEIRLRMGNLDGAEEAFIQASELGSEPEPARSLLRWYRGDAAAALRSIQRAVDGEAADRFARSRLLPALVEIAVAANDIEAAVGACDELDRLAQDYGGPLFEAAALHARAVVALATDDAEQCIRNLRPALKLWREIDAPYEGSQSRMLLARAYLALGDNESATTEYRAAAAVFERLGARRDAAFVAEAIAALAPKNGRVAVERAFMFTDVVQSTNLLEVIGDEAWQNLLSWLDRTLRAHFQQYRGEEVDHAGDGFFVAFDDASAAVTCAVGIQRSLRDHRESHGFAPDVRIGVHLADALRAEGSYQGKGVHQAARIASQASAREILVSTETLRAAGTAFTGLAPYSLTLKGIAEPMEVCAVCW